MNLNWFSFSLNICIAWKTIITSQFSVWLYWNREQVNWIVESLTTKHFFFPRISIQKVDFVHYSSENMVMTRVNCWSIERELTIDDHWSLIMHLNESDSIDSILVLFKWNFDSNDWHFIAFIFMKFIWFWIKRMIRIIWFKKKKKISTNVLHESKRECAQCSMYIRITIIIRIIFEHDLTGITNG